MSSRAASSHPFLLVALVALLVFAARVVGAQQTAPSAGHVPVAARALARGEVLGTADIIYRDTTLHGPIDTASVAAGWVTRRAIAAGEVLREPAVEPPIIVAANTPVQLEWNDHDVHISVAGTATSSAALGERVMVRTEAGRRIEGTVVAPGHVRID
jgi:flagella basal body P-ring formation protein FlgA